MLKRNLEWYPWLHVGHNALFWLPVFILYFSSMLSPAEVLLLEAVYYVGVVVLEVPSGYASDRLGRVVTLRVAATAWAVGCLVLATSTTFAALALGQLLLAVGQSFQSGTDSALLYDTLQSLGETESFSAREARAKAAGYAMLAGSAGVGGLIAAWDLAWVMDCPRSAEWSVL